MIRKSLFALLVAAALPTAHAAEPVGTAAKSPVIEPLAVTDATVGDAASFGRNVKWLGLLSGYGRLSADCTADPADTSPCQTLAPAPSGTGFDFPAVDSITIPGRSANSLLCHTQTP